MENLALKSAVNPSKPVSERTQVLEILTLLQPFHRLSPRTYFFDLGLSASVLWGSVWFVGSRELDLISAPFLILAFLAAYRSFSFMHEVVHFQKRIKFLSPTWNLLVGYPCMFPSLACFSAALARRS
ncbi:MAG: hypothetical protein AAB250_08715, partial [Bdellovibrionota bacterium]